MKGLNDSMPETTVLYPINNCSRRAVLLDGLWKFKFDPNCEGRSERWASGLTAPIMIPVPSSFADLFTDKDSREFCGDFWYETDVFIPPEWVGMEVDIRFGCATHTATVYINGKEITTHTGGFLPFNARVTDIVEHGRINRLSVLVNNELNDRMIPCGKTVLLPSGKKMAQPFFDFFNYSGLQRSVFLVATPKEAVQDFSIVTRLEGADAVVEYTVTTNGVNKVTVELLDEENNSIVSCDSKKGVLRVQNARLWQVRNAYLYSLKISVGDKNELLDEYSQKIGLRTIEIKGIDILINNKPVYLKGFGKHEDSDIIGRGFSYSVLKRDFELLKWVGANSIRTSHYPYSEEFYQMADREGFLVIDEVAAVGMYETAMNPSEASTGQSHMFFDRDSIPQLLENHLKTLEELIQRDKNYACVFAWSLFNEPESSDPKSQQYIETVFNKALELDPQKRPRTFAIIMMSRPDTCKGYQFSDFICLNRYYGWYLLGGYQIETAERALRKELDEWLTNESNKPYVFTEYGADTSASTHKLPSVMWSQEYQQEFLEMYHKVFDSYREVKGEQIWNFADFQTTEGIMRMDGNKKGIFTRQRQPKEAAFYIKKRWESLPSEYKGG